MKDPCSDCDNLDTRDRFINKNHLKIETLKDYNGPVLSESFLKYKYLFEIAPDAMFIADADSGIILDANHSAAELMGIPVQRLIGMHHSKLHPADEAELYKKMFQQHVKQGTSIFKDDIYLCRTDGKQIPVQINSAIISLGNQKIIYGIFRDITEQKKMESSLKDSETAFSEMFKHAGEGILITDMDSMKLIYANPAICEMLGYTEKEMLTLHVYDIHPKDILDYVKSEFEILKEGIKKVVEFVMLCKDGSIIDVEATGAVINIKGKKRIFGFFKDISKQKQLTEHLKASQARFKRLAEAAFEAIAIHQDGTIIDVNQRFLDMFGCTSEELKTIEGINLFAPQSRDLVREKMTSRYEGRYEALGMKKDGTIFPIEVQAKESTMDGKPVRIGAIRDMSKQKEYEEKIHAANENLRLLIKGLVDPASIFDRNGIFIFMNDEGLRRLGLTLDEVVGKHPRDIFNEQVHQTHFPVLQKVFETHALQAITEQIYAQGENRWYETTLHPIKNADGQITNVLSISHDIHEEMILKEKVEQSEQKYQQLYEDAHVALFRITLDGILIQCNNACFAFFGYPDGSNKEDFFNEVSGVDYFVDKTRYQQFMETILKNKRINRFEAELKKVDGSTFWVSVSAKYFEKDSYIEGALSDITIEKVLSTTEQKILRILLQGKSNKEIARIVDRSVRTIEDHRSHIMSKLGVDNLVDLTRKAMEGGILPENQ